MSESEMALLPAPSGGKTWARNLPRMLPPTASGICPLHAGVNDHVVAHHRVAGARVRMPHLRLELGRADKKDQMPSN